MVTGSHRRTCLSLGRLPRESRNEWQTRGERDVSVAWLASAAACRSPLAASISSALQAGGWSQRAFLPPAPLSAAPACREAGIPLGVCGFLSQACLLRHQEEREGTSGHRGACAQCLVRPLFMIRKVSWPTSLILRFLRPDQDSSGYSF